MEWIDLSHRFEESMSVYPNDPSPKIEVICDYPQVTSFTFNTHLGTHMDAPRHVNQSGLSIDQLPVSFFQGSAFCIPCKNREQSSIISLEEVLPYEKEIQDVDFILFSTGYEDLWNKEDYQKEFPTLSHALAKWINQHNLKGIGLDSLSVDQDGSLVIHETLFEKESFVTLENLTNLKEVEKKKFQLFAFPLKIQNADGSPVRVVAEVKE